METPTTPIPSCIPTHKFERNEFGLICDPSVTYVYNEDGTINWRKMVKDEFLVPNKQVFERRGKPVPTAITGLEDSEIIILLGGIKKLAQTRGYESVTYHVVSPIPEYVVATCSICWIPNYETGGTSIMFSAIGDASVQNTTSFGRMYLGPIAENRAFCRAVRNFLQINIVSQEELNDNPVEKEEDAATQLLREVMSQHGITFDLVKQKLIEENVESAATFKDVNDIPRFKQFELIERIKKKAAEAAARATVQ